MELLCFSCHQIQLRPFQSQHHALSLPHRPNKNFITIIVLKSGHLEEHFYSDGLPGSFRQLLRNGHAIVRTYPFLFYC